MERLLIVSAVMSGVLILIILGSLQRAHIRVEYSVSWLVAAFSLFILSQWPELLAWVGPMLGIRTGPGVVVMAALCVFLVVLYRLSMIVSELKDNNIALAQKVALLEYHLRTLQQGPAADR